MAKVTAAVDGDGDATLARVQLPVEKEQEVAAARGAAAERLGQLRF
jgi:hypothetical protein